MDAYAMHVLAAIALGTFAQASPSAAKPPTAEVKLTLAEAPAPVRAAITKELGETAAAGAKVKRRVGKEGATEYHVDLQAQDLKTHFDFSEAGALVRKREELTTATVPKAIGDVVKREFGTEPVMEIVRLTQAGAITYEADAGNDDHQVEIILTPEGGLLRKTEKWKTPKMLTTTAPTAGRAENARAKARPAPAAQPGNADKPAKPIER